MKVPAPLTLDFASPPRRVRVSGILLCLGGALACGALGVSFQATLAERELLQEHLGATARPHRTANNPNAARDAVAAAAIETQLSVPWSRLLAELEGASQDVASTVSLLEVEPDAAKHLVRITAEARTLADALAYLERLQKSPVLRYPMLDSHELRRDDPEHPIRVKLSAEWRT
jgi:hypothetical protein